MDSSIPPWSSSDPSFADDSLLQNEELLCTMCARQKESKSRCITCHNYLCDLCDFAHGVMVQFMVHKVIPLDEGPFRQFDAQPGASRPKSNESSLTAVNSKVHTMLTEGKESLDKLLVLSKEIKHTLVKLGKERMLHIGQINDIYKQYQTYLTTERNNVVAKLETTYNEQYIVLNSDKESIDIAIRNFYSTMVNVMNMLSPEAQAACEDISSLTQEIQSICNGEGNSSGQNHLNQFPNLPLTSSNGRMNPDLPTLPTPASETSLDRACLIQIFKVIGHKGDGIGQFNAPHGFCLGFDEDIVVADSGNHRIQIFDKTGVFKMQFGSSGRHDGFLWHPRKVAFLRGQRRYVVCDRGYERSRMQLFTESGKFVKKVYIQFIDIVSGIAVTENEDIVVVDSVTPTLFIIGTNDFLRSIDCTSFIQEPSDVAVKGKELFVCDFKGHNIVVLDHDGNYLRKFGSDYTMNFPNGIDISADGKVMIGDCHGNYYHVTVYSTDGVFIREYRCCVTKVSRCCGLKLNTSGNLVTVDKNYHHIIILDMSCIA